jgi:hypothetical protein
MYFTGKDDGPSIEEFIKSTSQVWKEKWKFLVPFSFKEDASIWWKSLDFAKMMALSDEAFEKITFR